MVAYARIISALISFFEPIYNSEALKRTLEPPTADDDAGGEDSELAPSLAASFYRMLANNADETAHLSLTMKGIQAFLLENVIDHRGRALSVNVGLSGDVLVQPGSSEGDLINAALKLESVSVHSCRLDSGAARNVGANGFMRPVDVLPVVDPFDLTFTVQLTGQPVLLNSEAVFTPVMARLSLRDIFVVHGVVTQLSLAVDRIRDSALRYGLLSALGANDVHDHTPVPLTTTLMRTSLGIRFKDQRRIFAEAVRRRASREVLRQSTLDVNQDAELSSEDRGYSLMRRRISIEHAVMRPLAADNCHRSSVRLPSVSVILVDDVDGGHVVPLQRAELAFAADFRGQVSEINGSMALDLSTEFFNTVSRLCKLCFDAARSAACSLRSCGAPSLTTPPFRFGSASARRSRRGNRCWRQPPSGLDCKVAGRQISGLPSTRRQRKYLLAAALRRMRAMILWPLC